MKFKNVFFLSLFLFSSAFLFSQTKLIALKSHSGKLNALNIESADNFGLATTVKIDTVIFLSDSSVIEIRNEYAGGSHYNAYSKDTVIHSNIHFKKITFEEIKSLYAKNKNEIIFIGFKKITDQCKPEPKSKKSFIRYLFAFFNDTLSQDQDHWFFLL